MSFHELNEPRVAAVGAIVVGADGNEFLDVTSGFGVANLGHAAPAVVAAARRMLDRPLVHAMGDAFADESRVELLEALASFLPGLPKGILGCSGADAVQAAIKTATRGGRARRALAAATTARRRFGGDGLPRAVGRGGIREPPAGWLEELRAKCDAEGALLVYDEVYSGFGRTGAWFAFEALGAPPPDLICLGKAMAGGFPISVCLGTRAAMDAWGASRGEALHTQTFLGNPLGCAMARASLRELGRSAPALAGDAAPSSGAARRAASGPRGRGLMLAVDVPDPPRGGRLLRRGVLALPVGEGADFALGLVPPLTIDSDQLAFVADALPRVPSEAGQRLAVGEAGATPPNERRMSAWADAEGERSIIFGHHKSGHTLGFKLAQALAEKGGGPVIVHGGHWFGQGLDDAAALAAFPRLDAYFSHRCLTCFEGSRRATDRVVNIVRDPFAVVASAYAYHKRGSERGGFLFQRDLGERGGELAAFVTADATARRGLPVALSRDEDWADYLARLNTSAGVRAAMVRVDAWDLPEMMASARATASRPSFHTVCLERFMGDLLAFRDAVADVAAWLGFDKPTTFARFDGLHNGGGDHATGAGLGCAAAS
ncbi:N2-acetyl-L-ornithine:2-oxoglutarate 5-aminotransferase [Aureococcus anophagefferens]|nr:N2-acetyl-L-ornithine:2-oxoglutarate 5-aminotransferase [Aureococcus anophagefferens]